MNVNKKVIIAGARCFCIIMMLLQLVMLLFFLDQKVLPMSAVSGVSFFAFLLCVVLLEKENFYGFTVLLPTILLFYAFGESVFDDAPHIALGFFQVILVIVLFIASGRLLPEQRRYLV